MLKLSFLSLIVLAGIALADSPTTPSVTAKESKNHYSHSPLNVGVDVQYVALRYNKYDWGNGQTSNDHGHGFHAAIEWIFLGPEYGRMGLGFGTGMGAINNIRVGNRTGTLTTIPLELFLSYRFEYFHHQPLVPFVKFGMSNVFSIQRGMEEREQWYAYKGLDYSLGGEICLSGITPSHSRKLDLTQGINGIYLIFEYFKSSPLKQGSGPDLSHDEYRMGLRFEI